MPEKSEWELALEKVIIIKTETTMGWVYSAFMPIGTYPSDMKLIKKIDGVFCVEATQYLGFETRNMEKIYLLILKKYPEAKYGIMVAGKILLGRSLNDPNEKRKTFHLITKKRKNTGFPNKNGRVNIWRN